LIAKLDIMIGNGTHSGAKLGDLLLLLSNLFVDLSNLIKQKLLLLLLLTVLFLELIELLNHKGNVPML
jgi:hypothetical protein